MIWLHGLGADGSDFVPVVPELGLAEAPGVRFVFPNAPAIPVTCNGGYVIVFGKEFDKAWDNGENMGYLNMADIAFVAVATQAPGK